MIPAPSSDERIPKLYSAWIVFRRKSCRFFVALFDAAASVKVHSPIRIEFFLDQTLALAKRTTPYCFRRVRVHLFLGGREFCFISNVPLPMKELRFFAPQ